MAFDVNAFRAAHRPWSFTIGAGRAARTFTARHVSAPQVMEYEDRIARAGKDWRKLNRAVFWLLRLAFPWRPSYLLRGDPARIIATLEPAARVAAVRDFLAALRGGPIPTVPNGSPESTTRGPRSSTPTPTTT